jgi:hypothetical protein
MFFWRGIQNPIEINIIATDLKNIKDGYSEKSAEISVKVQSGVHYLYEVLARCSPDFSDFS